MKLSLAELARLRAEHVDDGCGGCASPACPGWVVFPCHAARLLEHFEPGPVPHLAGVQVGCTRGMTNE